MQIHFGFSYLGLLFLLMMIIPNIIWTKQKPLNYDSYEKKENKVLGFLEKIGQVLVTCISLLFNNFQSSWIPVLLLACLCMLLYEVYWIRYFLGPKTMKAFYCSLFGIPVPGASLPVFAFLLLGIYGFNIPLIVATIILGIGHIGIHLAHRKETK